MSLFAKKKTKSDDLEEVRDITDDVVEADFVPYAAHWDPHTIVTKNGEVLQTIKITGFTHEHLTSAQEDADLRTRIRSAIASCITDTGYALWVHTIRRKTNLQTPGEFKRDFAGYLDRFWNDRHDWEHKFTNEVYVTIVSEGESAKLSDPASLLRGIFPAADIRHREEYLNQRRDKLNAVVEKMLPILQGFGAKRLGVVAKDGVYYSEPCAFLGKLITMQDLEFPLAEIDLSHYLTDYDVTFGFNAMEVRMRDTGLRRFGSILTLKDYRELPTESLDKLLRIPAEFIISQCFDFINADKALNYFNAQKKLFDISKATDLSDKMGLTAILASDRGRATDFGEHQINVFLLADSLRALESGMSNAVGALSELGMIPMREDIKFEECYWSMLPGNFEFTKRLKPINTASIAGFANLSNFPAGTRTGNHWGPAVTTFCTAAGTPYFFNFHYGDNGHTSIIGPHGAGKTVLLNFLLAESRKFGGKLFLFDKDRGSEIFIRSLEGAYIDPVHAPADDALFSAASAVMGFDMTQAIAQDKVSQVLADLMQRIVAALDGSPSIVVFDEAWFMLDNPQMQEKIVPWLDQLKTKNAMAILATENIAQATASALSGKVIPKMGTQIYLSDEEADEAYHTVFGLSEREINYLRLMDIQDRHFLLKRGSDTIVLELNLSGMDDIIAVLSATPKHLKAMETAMAQFGTAPSQWMPKFLENK